MAEQQSFLGGAADAAPTAVETPAEQSTTGADTTPPSQAAAGQTAATPVATTTAETAPNTSGQAEAVKPAPVEVRVPEGVELDGGLLEAIKAGDPQKVVDAYAKAETQRRGELAAESEKWKAAVETDRELGGTNLGQTKAYLEKALTKFGSPEVRKLIDGLGVGNHPDLVRFIARVGKAMAEDTVAGTTAPTNGSGKPDYKGAWFGVPGYEGLNP